MQNNLIEKQIFLALCYIHTRNVVIRFRIQFIDKRSMTIKHRRCSLPINNVPKGSQKNVKIIKNHNKHK